MEPIEDDTSRADPVFLVFGIRGNEAKGQMRKRAPAHPKDRHHPDGAILSAPTQREPANGDIGSIWGPEEGRTFVDSRGGGRQARGHRGRPFEPFDEPGWVILPAR